ncbi:alpha/beta fold hydrolase [Pseudoroseomonas wenyumeiae]
MPLLARDFTVIVVDIRGMGSSQVMPGGYDKKTMQEDIYQLVRQLGYRQVNMVGHDIGAMVAFSLQQTIPMRPGNWRSWTCRIPMIAGSASRCFRPKGLSVPRSMLRIRLMRGGSPFTMSVRWRSGFSPATACAIISLTCLVTCPMTTPRSHRSIWQYPVTVIPAPIASGPAMPGTGHGRRTSAKGMPMRR